MVAVVDDFEREHNEFLKREKKMKEQKRERLTQFDFITDDQLSALGGTNWIIDDHVPEDSLGMVYGMPGSAKSFLVLDWALHVAARMTEWNGFAVSPGDVVYVAAEGVKGYHARIEAWKTQNGWSGRVGLHMIAAALKLNDHEAIEYVVANIERNRITPKLIIFDTFARCFDGDDNSARDVSHAITAMDALRRQTGAAVVIVHHSTKTDGSFRGSSALEGAVDFMIHLALAEGRVTARCEKMKDAAPFSDLSFALVEVDGSCVLVPNGTNVVPSLERPLTESAKLALRILPESGATHGEWVELFIAAGGSEGNFDRLRKPLVARGFVAKQGRRYVHCASQDNGQEIGNDRD